MVDVPKTLVDKLQKAHTDEEQVAIIDDFLLNGSQTALLHNLSFVQARQSEIGKFIANMQQNLPDDPRIEQLVTLLLVGVQSTGSLLIKLQQEVSRYGE